MTDTRVTRKKLIYLREFILVEFTLTSKMQMLRIDVCMLAIDEKKGENREKMEKRMVKRNSRTGVRLREHVRK